MSQFNPALSASSSIHRIVRCNICGKQFTAPAALIINPNAPMQGRMSQFLGGLITHIVDGHPNHAKAMDIKAGEFLGMLRLQNFHIEDEAIREQRDYLRWSVHQATLNAHFSDEKVEASCEMFAARCAEIMRDPNIAEAERVPIIKGLMGDIMLDLRNLLEEPGRYCAPDLVQTPETAQTSKF